LILNTLGCYGVLKVSEAGTARPFDTSAVIATGKYLFPFRTEKSSPLAPMVLGAQAPGRVGCRRFSRTTKGRRWAALRRSGRARSGGMGSAAPRSLSRSTKTGEASSRPFGLRLVARKPTQPRDPLGERRMRDEHPRDAFRVVEGTDGVKRLRRR
jgi:hypothetical protein